MNEQTLQLIQSNQWLCNEQAQIYIEHEQSKISILQFNQFNEQMSDPLIFGFVDVCRYICQQVNARINDRTYGSLINYINSIVSHKYGAIICSWIKWSSPITSVNRVITTTEDDTQTYTAIDLPFECKIRFNVDNTKNNDQWRLIIDNIEHLVGSVEVLCPLRTTQDETLQGTKFHITCNPTQITKQGNKWILK